jgi:hypothetical protein
MPNWTKISGLIRHILTFGGGMVVGQGYIDEATMLEVVGAVMTIAGAGWSYMAPEKKADAIMAVK